MSTSTDKCLVEGALSSLRRYIRAMYFSVEAPALDREAIGQYFESQDPARMAAFEKLVGAAAIEAIYAEPDIPDKYKERVARRAAEEFLDAFRGAKLDYEYAAGRLGQGLTADAEYERRKAELKLVRKATRLDRIKKSVKKLSKTMTKVGVRTLVKEAITCTGEYFGVPRESMKWVAVAAIAAVDAVVPPKVRERVKAKALDMAQKARAVIESTARAVAADPVIRKAAETVKRVVAPIITPVYEKAKEVAAKIGAGARSLFARLKARFA